MHGRGSDKAPVTLSVKCISVGLLLRIIFYLTAVGGRISNAMFMDDLVPSYGTWWAKGSEKHIRGYLKSQTVICLFIAQRLGSSVCQTGNLRRRTVDRYASAGRRFCDLYLWTRDLDTSSVHGLRLFKSLQWFRSYQVHKISIAAVAWLTLTFEPMTLKISSICHVDLVLSFIKIRPCIQIYKGVKRTHNVRTQRPKHPDYYMPPSPMAGRGMTINSSLYLYLHC